MNLSQANLTSQAAQASQLSGSGEDTLRLIASLPAPEGLEERIRTGLHAQSKTGNLLAWREPVPTRRGWLRGAAAAAIVCVVVGGSWSIAPRGSAGQAANAVTAPSGTAAPGGFSSAGAIRTPHTLDKPAAIPAAVQPAIGKEQATAAQKQKTKSNLHPPALKRPAATKLTEPAK